MKSNLRAAAFGLALCSWPLGAADAAAPPCAEELTRRNVVACALLSSPALREELASQRAAEGRRAAVNHFFPSNPIVAGQLSSRSTGNDRNANWSLSVEQEVEVAGQSFLRKNVAEQEVRAQQLRVSSVRAATAAEAWTLYFSVLAGQERQKLTRKMASANEAVAETVRAMAQNGLVSEVDADVAEAAALRARQDELAIEASVAESKARLSVLVGGVPSTKVAGQLEPVRLPPAEITVESHPELLALKKLQEAQSAKASLIRRERVPNPSISGFAQNDGFDERVLGVGLSVPIPLPEPLGRTLLGELSEANALADRAEAEAARARRELQAEVWAAQAAFDSASKARALYTPERIERVNARVDSIGAQVRAARLAVRDAVVAQQALVEQLKAEIDAREAQCLASVRLARAAGLSLEEDSL